MRVLVAEDDKETRELFRRLLQAEGFEVVEATCGFEALDVIEQQDPPALVILDWMMPPPDGIALCRRLRELDRDNYAYVIMLTARTGQADMLEAFNAGVDDFLFKPFRTQELTARLRVGKRIVQEIAARRRLQEALVLAKEAQKRRGTIHQLESIATSFSLVRSLGELGAAVEKTVETMLDVRYTGVYLFDKRSDHLRLLFAKGFTEEERAEAERTAMDRHPGGVFRSGQMLHVPDTDQEPDRSISSARSFVIRSRLYLPVVVSGECVGCFGLGSSTPGAFSDEHIHVLQFVGNMAAVVYQNLRSREENAAHRQRLAGILKGTNSGTWEWNIQTGEAILDERSAEMVGYSLAELSPASTKTWAALCHPDDFGMRAVLLDKHFRGELDHFEIEARMKHKSGSWIWVHELGRVVSWTDDGKPLWMMGTHHDITARKRTEEELRHKTGQFSSLLDSIPDIVFFKDVQGVYLGCNPLFAEFVGKPRHEIVGKTDYDLFDKKTADFFREHDRHMLARSKPSHNDEWITYPDGRRVLLDTLKTPYRGPEGELIGVLGISRDVTVQREAEEILRTSEATQGILLESINVGVMIIDPKTHVIERVNPTAVQLLARTEGQIVGSVCHRFICPAEEGRCPVTDLGRMVDRSERVLLTPDGRHVPVLKSVRRVQLNGRDRLVESFVDITDLKQTETRLNAARERLSATLRSIGDGVISTAADGTVESLNQVAERLTGWRTEEAAGRPVEQVFRIIDQKTRKSAENPVEQALRQRKAVELANDTVLVSRTGAEYQIADSCAPIRDATDAICGAVLVFRDVTDSYRRRRQLAESEGRFEQLTQQSRTVVWEAAPNGAFLYSSSASRDVFGYEPEELVQRMSIKDLHPEDVQDACEKAMLDMVAGKQPLRNSETPAISKDGRPMWTAINVIPLFFDDGRLRAYRGSHTDITDRKTAEQTVENYEVLLLAVSLAAAQFVASKDWSETLREVLPKLGKAARASRAYFFGIRQRLDGCTLASQSHEWCAAGIGQQIDNPDLQGIPLREAGYQRWEDLLVQRQMVAGFVREFPQSERDILEAQAIVSLVVAPVFAGSEWVGFLGLDECAGSRVWSMPEREVLTVVADAIGSAILRQKAESDLRRAREREIDVGGRIQTTLLRGNRPEGLHGVDFGAVAIPSQHVDGDFWEVFPHSDAVFDFVLGDVMGKGVAAALIGAATMRQLLRVSSDGTIHRGLRPIEDTVNSLNRSLSEQLVAVDAFVTMCLGRIDVTRYLFSYVDCGHTSVLHCCADGRIDVLKGDGLPLGVRADERYRQIECPFEEGDVFVVYSDGVIEAKGGDGQMYGIERLHAVVAANHSSSPAEIVETIRRDVVLFSGREEFSDDFTCLVFAIRHDARRYECHMTSELEHLEIARTFVRRTCQQKLAPSIRDEDVHLLELATNEAFTNLVKHAYHHEPGHPIDLAIELQAEHVVVELRHWGSSFDPDAVEAPTFDGSREGGFGLHIIKQSVDDLVFETEEDGATVVRMRKSIASRATGVGHPVVQR